MVFLDFEKPLESLFEQLNKIKQVGEQGDLDVSPMIDELMGKINNKRKEIYDNLTPVSYTHLTLPTILLV